MQRNGSTVEINELKERLLREFELVVKRHERYLLFAEEDDIEDQEDWLRLVYEDHERALKMAADCLIKRVVAAQPDTPTLPGQTVQLQAQIHADADYESDGESHVAELERLSFRPMSVPSMQSFGGFRAIETPPLSNAASSYQPANPLQRVARQVGNLTSRAIDFFTPKRSFQPLPATNTSHLYSQESIAFDGSLAHQRHLQKPSSRIVPADNTLHSGQSFRPVTNKAQPAHPAPPVRLARTAPEARATHQHSFPPPDVPRLNSIAPAAQRVAYGDSRRQAFDSIEPWPESTKTQQATVRSTHSAPRQTPVATFGSGANANAFSQTEHSRDQLNAHSSTFMPSSYQDNAVPLPNGNSHDAWINAPDFTFYQRPTSAYRPPKLELMKFDGNPLNWPLFIQSFKAQVHDAVSNDAERIAHLNNCLAPEVGAHLGIALRDPGLYRYALQELQATYGSQIVIAKSCSSILRSLRSVHQGDYAALSKLSATLKSVVATYQLCGFESELKSYDTVDRVLQCLPERLQERWYYSVCEKFTHVPTLVDLSNFINNAFRVEYTRRIGFPEAQMKTTLPNTQLAKPSSFKKSAKPGVFSIAVADKVECPVCKASHALSDCKQFRQLTLDKRFEVVRTAKACLRCLNSGHISKNCDRKQKCGLSGCEKLHNRPLHDAPRIYPERESKGSPENPVKQPTNAVFAGAIGRGKSSVTLLPVVPVVVEANDSSYRTWALLDQGSEITIIRADIARRLQLAGLTISLKIDTVNGELSQDLVKLPELVVCSRDKRTRIPLHEAFAVERLRIDLKTKSVEALSQKWPHLAGLDLQSPSPADVTMIIGADQHQTF